MKKKSLVPLLLWAQRPKSQLWIGAFAFWFGFVFLLLAWQSFLDVSSYIKNNRPNDEYLVINKKISFANTLFGSSSGFAKEELDTLSKQPFLVDYSPFKSSRFQASIFAEKGINFYTLIFFESIPDRFLEAVPSEWKNWKPGTPEVPIIVSRDFLNLYNFGFAASQGLPQLSEGAFQMVTLKLRLKGEGKQEELDVKVAGFTNRARTILVPESFIEYANKNFSSAKDADPGRLILQVKDRDDPKLAKYLETKGYVTGEELSIVHSIEKISAIAFSLTGAIGLVFMILSLILFGLVVRLAVAETKHKLKLLFQLSYYPNEIVRYVFRPYLVWLLTITGIGFAIWLVAIFSLKFYLGKLGLELESGIHISSAILALAIMSLSGFWVFATIRIEVYKGLK